MLLRWCPPGPQEAIHAQCSKYAWTAPVAAALLPWSERGFSAAQANETLLRRSVAGGPTGFGQALGFGFWNGTLHVLTDATTFLTYSPAARDLIVYVYALLDVARAFRAALPDVELVVTFSDTPEQRPFDQPTPLLNYCRAAETADIPCPYNGWYYDSDFFDAAAAAPPRPLGGRADEAFAAYTEYSARYTQSRSTQRLDAGGSPLADQSPRTLLSAWGPSRPAAEAIHLGGPQRRAMPAWADSRYLVHVDGIGCSAKLEKALALGSLVLKEESGLLSFFSSLLLPFVHYVPFWRQRPQELLWALAWARRHGRDAERIAAAGQAFVRRQLSPPSLRCYWALLWAEIAALQRFDPGPQAGQRAYPAAVPADEFLLQARPRARRPGFFWVRRRLRWRRRRDAAAGRAAGARAGWQGGGRAACFGRGAQGAGSARSGVLPRFSPLLQTRPGWEDARRR